jgi:hypothetical protein
MQGSEQAIAVIVRWSYGIEFNSFSLVIMAA